MIVSLLVGRFLTELHDVLVRNDVDDDKGGEHDGDELGGGDNGALYNIWAEQVMCPEHDSTFPHVFSFYDLG